MRLVKRPTISDLATVSGVSVATIDRVLNGRLPVREETAQRVYDAAKQIGFHAAGLIKQRIRQDLPELRLGFLLQRPEQHFYQDFTRELQAAASAATQFRGVPVVDYWENQSPDEIVLHLNRLASRTRAIALVSPDHPTVTAAVEALRARGIPVFSLLSDFAAGVREGYVGTNNRKCGRTAGWMIARCAKRPGKVAVFVGSHRFHGHELREIGLRSYFREHAPEFSVMETLVNLETPELTHRAMIELLRTTPDLVGCYIAGGGMEGAVSALREMTPQEMPVMVCNELTPISRQALADDIVTVIIATPQARIAREVVEQMGHAVRDGAANVPGQTFLPFDIYLSENI